MTCKAAGTFRRDTVLTPVPACSRLPDHPEDDRPGVPQQLRTSAQRAALAAT
jgi:hypothetical protein